MASTHTIAAGQGIVNITQHAGPNGSFRVQIDTVPDYATLNEEHVRAVVDHLNGLLRKHRAKKDRPRACPDDHTCRKCKKVSAACFVIDEIHEDIEYTCHNCGHRWTVEGPDA